MANAFNQYVITQRFALSLFNVREGTMVLLLALQVLLIACNFARKITAFF